MLLIAGRCAKRYRALTLPVLIVRRINRVDIIYPLTQYATSAFRIYLPRHPTLVSLALCVFPIYFRARNLLFASTFRVRDASILFIFCELHPLSASILRVRLPTFLSTFCERHPLSASISRARHEFSNPSSACVILFPHLPLACAMRFSYRSFACVICFRIYLSHALSAFRLSSLSFACAILFPHILYAFRLSYLSSASAFPFSSNICVIDSYLDDLKKYCFFISSRFGYSRVR